MSVTYEWDIIWSTGSSEGSTRNGRLGVSQSTLEIVVVN